MRRVSRCAAGLAAPRVRLNLNSEVERVTLLVIFGCATYGKIRPMGQELTIEMLRKNWQNYDVYWTGLSERTSI